MLKKQAKTLTDAQVKMVLSYLKSCSRNCLRNQVMFLLSFHGLRAKEIAELQISMIVNSEGEISDEIALEDRASKGKSGRRIPINPTLKSLLVEYVGERTKCYSGYVVQTERSENFSANAVAVFFKRLYQKLGLVGCSSHSGRRTFITKCARQVSTVGGSLRDVMRLAGHRQIGTTETYIVENADAQRA